MTERLAVAAPAKVNLVLRVLARETGGFHQIETVFAALDLTDEITVERGPAGVALEVEGDAPADPRTNLAGRAALAFLAAAGARDGVRVRLRKRLPTGAGLGGGSSDAGATLRALNVLFGHPLERARLLDLGAGLGSDVPFFAAGVALALAWGRGERLLRLPSLPEAPCLVVVPPFSIATADAYAAMAEARAGTIGPPSANILDPVALSSWERIAELAANDFEPVLLARHPELARALSLLRETGPLLALLSGSGSALFAVYPDDDSREAARAFVLDAGCGRVLPARTVRRVEGPVPAPSDGPDVG